MVALYAALGVLLWPVPLLGLLHAESSALVAATAYFAAGLSSISLLRAGVGLFGALSRQLAALVVPLALLTVTLIWRPNCGFVDGLMYFILFPVVTVVFTVALAYALDRWTVPRSGAWLVGIGICICVFGPIYDIGFHPQFYTYNHVFGGVLGPVYDEELAVRPGLFVFRCVTLLCAIVFVLLGRLGDARRSAYDGPGARLLRRLLPAFAVGVLVLAYAFAEDGGWITTSAMLKAELGGHQPTEHFDIYFSPAHLSGADLQVIADEHEFRYAELIRMLGVEPAERVESYIYPDADTKAELTGARYTNVAPVWLATPQLHVLQAQFTSSFGHELVHVFSREFGMPILNASPAIGLVEGLAVALEPPDGLPTPNEQVSAALLSEFYDEERNGGQPAAALAGAVASRLSPLDFWTGRGAVSYTTMGSFVRYLFDGYGAERLKRVYAAGDFAAVYGRSVERLAEDWAESLLALPSVASSTGPFAAARFAVPSLIEKRCPHYVPAYRRDFRRATTALIHGDTAAAVRLADSSLRGEPRYLPALDLWSRLTLARGEGRIVRERIEPLGSDSVTAAILVRLGDARALTGDSTGARRAYERALRHLPSFAHEDASRIHLRRVAASRPELVRTMLGGAGPPSGDDMLATIGQIFYFDRIGAHEQAADLVRTTHAALEDDPHRLRLEGAAVEAVQRRQLVWLARFHYLAGALSAASSYALDASAAYRATGAFNEADVLDDFRRKMIWLDRSQSRR